MLYYTTEKGGDNIQQINNNLFYILYSLYTFFDMILFHNLQGSKLKIKQKTEV